MKHRNNRRAAPRMFRFCVMWTWGTEQADLFMFEVQATSELWAHAQASDQMNTFITAWHAMHRDVRSADWQLTLCA